MAVENMYFMLGWSHSPKFIYLSCFSFLTFPFFYFLFIFPIKFFCPFNIQLAFIFSSLPSSLKPTAHLLQVAFEKATNGPAYSPAAHGLNSGGRPAKQSWVFNVLWSPGQALPGHTFSCVPGGGYVGAGLTVMQ